MNKSQIELPLKSGRKLSERWLEILPKSAQTGPFLILGLGTGFHVTHFFQTYPDSFIYVFDYNFESAVEVRTRFYKNFPIIENKEKNITILINDEIKFFLSKFDVNKFEAIHSFRPSWTGYEKEFEKLELELLGKSWKEKMHSLKNSDSILKILGEMVV